jgi:signal transduction histidine kinase
LKLFEKLKEKHHKYILITPVIFIVSCFLFASILVTKFSLQQEIDQTIISNQVKAEKILNEKVGSNYRDSIFILNQLMKINELSTSFNEKNRANLSKITIPIFKELLDNYGFTNLSFHNLDGTNFFRAHDPNNFGDLIQNSSLKNSILLKSAIMTIENNSNNSLYSLKVIKPWLLNNQIIGYVEIGKNISNIALDISREIDIPIYMTLHKSKKAETNNNLNQLSNFSNEIKIFSNFQTNQINVIRKNNFTSRKNLVIDKIDQYTKIEIKDQNLNPIGHVVFVFNLQALFQKIQNIDYAIIGLGILMIIVLSFYFQFAIQVVLNKENQIGVLSKFATLGKNSSILVHELRGQLTVIQLHAQYLKKKVNNDDKILKSLGYIENSIFRLNKVIEANRKQGIFKVEKKQESINSILEEVESLTNASLYHHNIKLTFELLSRDLILYVNSVQIIQVFLNLINNAKDALDEYNGERWIKIEFLVKEKNLIICFTNSGPKINEAITNKLFTEYFTTKPADKGTGLGLTLSKKIAIDHHGDLYFDNKCEFTKFVFVIPLDASYQPPVS